VTRENANFVVLLLQFELCDTDYAIMLKSPTFSSLITAHKITIVTRDCYTKTLKHYHPSYLELPLPQTIFHSPTWEMAIPLQKLKELNSPNLVAVFNTAKSDRDNKKVSKVILVPFFCSLSVHKDRRLMTMDSRLWCGLKSEKNR